MKRLASLIVLILFTVTINAQRFVHPGILHSEEDLQRIKEAVAKKTRTHLFRLSDLHSKFCIAIHLQNAGPISNGGKKSNGWTSSL